MRYVSEYIHLTQYCNLNNPSFVHCLNFSWLEKEETFYWCATNFVVVINLPVFLNFSQTCLILLLETIKRMFYMTYI